MSKYVEQPVRPRPRGKESRRVCGISHSYVFTWAQQEWWVSLAWKYYLLLTHHLSSSDLNLFVGQLTLQQKSNPCVLHALNVQRALSMGNYHLFFSLYNTVPNMGGYIMDHFVERERIRALLVMTKSYVSQHGVLCRTSASFPVQIHLGTYGFHRQRTRIRDRLRNT